MLSRVVVASLGLALLLGPPVAAQTPTQSPPPPSSPEEWRAVAEADVNEAYQVFVDNHPGMYDAANPSFPATLAEARDRGLAAAGQVQDRTGYERSLAIFSSVLSDGHALVQATRSQAATQEQTRHWPGFAALWRQDQLFVVTPDPNSPLANTTIVACDGLETQAFLSDRLRVRNFRGNEAGQWWVVPSRLFWAIGEPAADQPRRCTFRTAEGRDIARDLEWQPASPEDRSFYSGRVFASAEPIGLHEPRPGLFVIGLGDFQPDEAGRAAYARLYEDLNARRDDLRAARAVVLDLRGNQGGSSQWSHQVAEILWGVEAVQTRIPPIVGIDWRTSEGNIAYIRNQVSVWRERGMTELADDWTNVATQMEAAAARGEPLWREASGRGDAPGTPIDSDFERPVYVINWGLCASACLDANDYFGLFDNTRRIGSPTSADSTYMEVRAAPLTSGQGVVVIPNKTWVGRQRGWGEVYGPDIPMTGLDWSTDAFLDRIEQDLADRAR
jgi:hypothetical protein